MDMSVKEVSTLKGAFEETANKMQSAGFSFNECMTQISNAIIRIIKGEGFEGFTRNNGARDFIQSMGADDFIDELCRYYIDAYGGIENVPNEDAKKNYHEYAYKNEGYQEAMKSLRSQLVFTPEDMVSVIVNRVMIGNVLTNSIPEGMKNVEVNYENMAIATGTGRAYKYKALEVGEEMHAVSSVGKVRSNQEDAVLLITHPNNPEFKLMAVADGVGGCDKGEIASDIAVKLTRDWFCQLDVNKYLTSIEDLVEDGEAGYLVNSIDSKIIETLGQGSGATTFCCTIVGKDDTITFNIGDSRAYAVTRDGLKQITQDDSAAYQKFQNGEMKKDDIRFWKKSNGITACLGRGVANKARYYIMPNSDYSSIVVCSDGVTDILSDEQLYCACKSSPRDRIAENIASKALDHFEQARYDLKEDPEFNDYVQGGKDNTTVAVFSKPEKQQKGIRGLMAKLKSDKGKDR